MLGANIIKRGQGQMDKDRKIEQDKMLRQQNTVNLLAFNRSAIDDTSRIRAVQ